MADQLDSHPQASRIRARRQNDAVLTLVVDASGLDSAGRNALEAELKMAASELDGVEEVRVAMTSAKDSGPIMIAIGSGKGGVGKSTITANLAVALAKKGKKVGVVDADIYGPSQPTLLDAHDRATAKEKVLQPVASKYGVPLLSVGQLVSEGHALAWRGPMAAGALQQLLDGDWAGTELLLIDLPPGTGDVQLSLVQKARPAGAVIISTPQDLSLIDATRAVDLFNKTSVPMLGLIENMAGYQCPHCGEESDPFGQGGAEEGAKKLDLPFLGRLPLSLSLREASDAGTPPAAGDGPAADAFAALADAILEQLEKVAA